MSIFRRIKKYKVVDDYKKEEYIFKGRKLFNLRKSGTMIYELSSGKYLIHNNLLKEIVVIANSAEDVRNAISGEDNILDKKYFNSSTIMSFRSSYLNLFYMDRKSFNKIMSMIGLKQYKEYRIVEVS
jgi:hypothetical protein